MSVFTNTSLLTPLLEQAVQHCSKLYQLSTPLLEQSVHQTLQTRISEDPACAGPICSVAAQLAIVEQREKREQKQQQQQGQCIQA